jgi:hypothetical protein
MSDTPQPMPACWTIPEHWPEWNRLNVLARDNPSKPLDHFCTDCTPEFKERMVAAGRCAFPQVRFVRIIERQYDPVKGARKEVVTLAVKGVR